MSDSEFTLDINNPEEPKILYVGNNRPSEYLRAALGLYNSRIVKLINKKGMLKSSVITTSCRRYTSKGWTTYRHRPKQQGCRVWIFRISASWCVTTGTKSESGDEHGRQYFSGQVGEQPRRFPSGSVRCCRNGSPSPSTGRMFPPPSTRRWTRLIPPSKISGLTQGMFVGSVSDNFNERIRRFFIARLWWMPEKVKREECHKKILSLANFTWTRTATTVRRKRCRRTTGIKEEVKQIAGGTEYQNDPVLCKLLPDYETV